MRDFKLLDRFAAAKRYYSNSGYSELLEQIEKLLGSNHFEATMLLNKLPSKEELLKTLVESLKGKSVYKTLKKISENKVESPAEMLKGLFSLGTHISIEVDKGHGEYKALYPVVYEKIGKILYKGI